MQPTDVHVLPRDLGPLFAHRPLILGESEANYDLLLSKATKAVAPTDVVEDVWVKDIADLTWDAERGKRLKASLLMTARKKALDRLIAQTDGPHLQSAEPLTSAYTNAWLQGEPAAVETFNRLLAERGLDVNSVMALALSECLGDIERIDRMIASAEARRNRILLEIELRREVKARQQRSTEEVTTVSWRAGAGPNQW
ncbi:hypothetical protein JKG68_20080 [Microvirga aerilata]|uniref:Uncharacterized protein n=1 Tax=Microvirga aerilata TaxID=670292 RepID=A0A937D1U1_9HYPH|nr:hypothetical protein [Microvirga aerilata]MBL0406262.1 hypothetical protein [Microvirga aerilata]